MIRVGHIILGGALVGLVVCKLAGQTPVLGNVETPYPAVQSPVTMAGVSPTNPYSAGAVSYGPVGTPLVLTGSDLGASGTVQFIGYKNGVVDPRTTVQANVTMWSATMLFLTVPSGAVSGLINVTVEGKTSAIGLPFIVTPGAYSASCPAGPTSNQLQIATASLHDGTVDQSYSATLGATGGSDSYTWSLANGSLPTGLSLSAGGVISGTPTAAIGPVDLTFKVADTSAPQQGDQAVLSLTIESQALTPGTIYSFASSYDHVGNLTSYSDTVMGSWGLTYDTLNRLRTAQAIAGDFSQQMPYACWSYDSFGNRVAQEQSPVAFQSGSGGPNACTPQTSATVSTVLASVNSDNQITSTNARGVTDIPTYDGAGNMQTDGANQYLYDPEGRICAVQGTTMDGITAMTGYLYDAGGNRIAKGIISSMSCDPSVNGFQVTGTYVLDKGGEELTTLDGGGDWMRTNVYAAGKLLATYDMVGNPVPANGLGSQMAGLHFHLTDPLGTRRVQVSGNIYPTNASGTLFNTVGQPETDIQSLPYGDGLYSYPDPQASATADDATPLHFTGKERDTESGNDYFGARYYASSMGRFLSPDPKLISRKRMLDPQGWNMYAYARNNPLILIDPDGAEWQWAGARNSGNAAALVHAMAIAYASNGKFRGNFDRIANSKSTIVHLSDRAVQDTTYHGSPVVGVNFGGTGLTKSSYTVSNGAVTAVTNPVNAVEQVDVTKALNSGGATDLGTVVKHETEHAVQIDSDPIGYQNAAIGANPQGSSLETEAQAAGSDTTSGSSMTFGDAQNAVMNGLGLTNADLYPDIQTETPTINATIQEESNANRPPQTNP